MLKFLQVAALIAAIIVVSGSLTINALFAASFGRTAFETYVLGAIGIGLDALKAVLAVLLGTAFAERRWWFVGIGGALFALLVCLGLAAAIGFAGSGRSHTASVQDTRNQKLAALERSMAAHRDEIAALPPHRAAAIVGDALVAMEAEPRFRINRCTAMTPGTRGFCESYGKLRAEKVAAEERDRLEQLVAQIVAERDRLRGEGAGRLSEGQIQVSAIARLLGIADEAKVQQALLLAFSIVLELSASVAVFLAVDGKVPARAAPVAPPSVALAPVAPLQPVALAADTSTPDAPAAQESKSRPPLVLSVRPANGTRRPPNRSSADAKQRPPS